MAYGRWTISHPAISRSAILSPAPLGNNARAMALFVSSFLVLFLEIALIRWMPAYVRLLAYFSNFILLASFLGIGVGCLLAAPPAQSVRLVPADSARGDRRGRPPAARGRRPEHVDDLFHERHRGTGGAGREHAAAAAALHGRCRAVRHRGASHGPRAGRPAAAAGLRDQSAGQPRGRRRVRARLVAAAAADRLVRRRRGRGAAVRLRRRGGSSRPPTSRCSPRLW